MATIRENEWKKTNQTTSLEIEWATAVAEYQYLIHRAI